MWKLLHTGSNQNRLFFPTYHFIFRNFDNIKHVVDFSRVFRHSVASDGWQCCCRRADHWFAIACSHCWHAKCCNVALHRWWMRCGRVRWWMSANCRTVSSTVRITWRVRTHWKSTGRWWRQARRSSKCRSQLMSDGRCYWQTWHRQLRRHHL